MKFNLLILTIALLAGTGVAQKSGPAQTVSAYYKFNATRSETFNKKGLDARRSWFSAQLNRLFDTELRRERAYLKKSPTDKPHFGDGFPFIPSDECYRMGKFYPHRVVTGTARTRGNRSEVDVKFYLSKVCGGDFITTFKVGLIRSRGKWLIDDWTFDDGSKLSDDLKREEY